MISSFYCHRFPNSDAWLWRSKSNSTRLEAGVASLKRVQITLKRYHASVLKAACEGRLVPTEAELARQEKRIYEPGEELLDRILRDRQVRRQNTYKRNAKYTRPVSEIHAVGMATLPEGWAWASIDQLAIEVADCPHSTPKWTTQGPLCIRTADFRPGRVELSHVRYVSEETYRQRTERLVPQAGDILYSREGGILGIACLVPSGVRLCLGQRMMVIRIVSPLPSTYFLNVLNSPLIHERVWALTGGSASPHLNVADIKEFPMPLPPLAEQQRIVAEVERRLSIVEELEAMAAANLKRAERLRQSILHRAFSGNL